MSDLTAADIVASCAPKSEQLNADDLLAGPMTGRIVRVTAGSAEQPINVYTDASPRPWRPCKTDRRVMVAMWGPDPSRWVGQSVRLTRDATVRLGPDIVGGIRVTAASIDKPLTVQVTASRGKKTARTVEVLRVESAPTFEDRRADLARLVSERGMVDDVDALHGPVETWTPEACKAIAGMLRGGS